jgi:hypothetical protein
MIHEIKILGKPREPHGPRLLLLTGEEDDREEDEEDEQADV